MSKLFQHSPEIIEEVFISFSEDERMKVERIIPALSTLFSNFTKKGSVDIDTFLTDVFERANIEDVKSVDLNEFKEVVNIAYEYFDEIQGYIDLFRIFDTGNKGYIDYNDLKAARQVISKSKSTEDEIKDDELLDMLLVGVNFQNINKVNKKESLVEVFEASDSDQSPNRDLKLNLKMFCRLLDNIEHNEL